MSRVSEGKKGRVGGRSGHGDQLCRGPEGRENGWIREQATNVHSMRGGTSPVHPPPYPQCWECEEWACSRCSINVREAWSRELNAKKNLGGELRAHSRGLLASTLSLDWSSGPWEPWLALQWADCRPVRMAWTLGLEIRSRSRGGG